MAIVAFPVEFEVDAEAVNAHVAGAGQGQTCVGRV